MLTFASNSHKKITGFIKGAGIGLGIIALFFLVKSLIQVGMQYTLDVDELFHIHTAFEMRIGKLPYKDFLFPYAPVAQWALFPFLMPQNPEESIVVARIISTVMYLLKLTATGVISVWLLGGFFGILAIVGIASDPFTSFSGMQFRPDVFAVFFQSLCLLSFFLMQKYKSGFWSAMTGICIVLTVFSSLKVLPFAVGLMVSAWFLESKSIKKNLSAIVWASALTLVVCIAPFIVNGTIADMFRNVFIYAKSINDSLQYPLNILNFYWPVNWYLYGFIQGSATWYWEILIPLLSVAAMAVSLLATGASANRKMIAVVIPALFQAASLFFIRSVFIQYHLGSNWLLIILAIWLTKQVAERLFAVHAYVGMCYLLLLIAAAGAVSYNAVQNYAARSQVFYRDQLQGLDTTGAQIPYGQAVFPGYFFRPNGAYLGYGWNLGDLPQHLQATISNELVDDTHKSIQFLYLSDDQIKYLSAYSQQVMNTGFSRSPTEPALWVKKR